MSRATKRKHVQMEVLLDDLSLPSENQQIVKVLSSKGNNLHEVESADGSNFLISMPTKFRKNIWVRRGNFILVEPIKEGDKVKGEMVRVLTKEHIKYYKKEGKWPVEFDKESNGNINYNASETPDDTESDSESEIDQCKESESDSDNENKNIK